MSPGPEPYELRHVAPWLPAAKDFPKLAPYHAAPVMPSECARTAFLSFVSGVRQNIGDNSSVVRGGQGCLKNFAWGEQLIGFSQIVRFVGRGQVRRTDLQHEVHAGRHAQFSIDVE